MPENWLILILLHLLLNLLLSHIGPFLLQIGPSMPLSVAVDLFIKLSIPRTSVMKVVAAVHNNFVEDVMNITYKLKTTPWPSNLPKFTYLTYSSLPPRPYTNHVTPELIG